MANAEVQQKDNGNDYDCEVHQLVPALATKVILEVEQTCVAALIPTTNQDYAISFLRDTVDGHDSCRLRRGLKSEFFLI